MYHHIVEMKTLRVGAIVDNNTGGYDIELPEFIFESILHNIESWYYLFVGRTERLDEEEGAVPERFSLHNIACGEEVYSVKIERRQHASGRYIIELSDGEKHHCYRNPADAAKMLCRMIAESIEETAARQVKQPTFTVTDVPCGDMWNPTSFCIVRTGEGICLSCNSKLEEGNEVGLNGNGLQRTEVPG